ncbi:hypothetical protein PAMA_001497 [Pampus argenteus]
MCREGRKGGAGEDTGVDEQLNAAKKRKRNRMGEKECPLSEGTLPLLVVMADEMDQRPKSCQSCCFLMIPAKSVRRYQEQPCILDNQKPIPPNALRGPNANGAQVRLTRKDGTNYQRDNVDLLPHLMNNVSYAFNLCGVRFILMCNN